MGSLKKSLLLTWFLGCTSLAAALAAAAPEQVARIHSGELKEARASWWGFDTENSTAALQAAVNSRVPRLIIDRQSTPWITEPLTLVSNQEIFFEEGVEVLARKGAFHAKTDSLLSLTGLTNVTLRGYGAVLRMRRADYDAPPYLKAEWRHVLSIRGCADIRVYGLTLAESGGDGIYLGSFKGAPANHTIHIKDVLCDRNYRQGISVISAENLLIENTIMRDTAGTPPAAGIDFEPNTAGERLKNIVMRNCLTSGNAGDGYEFYLPNLNQQSEPVSIRIENCRSDGDRTAVRVVTGNREPDAVRGSLVFSDCEFKDAVRNGLEISGKPESGMALAFERCVIAGCAPGADDPADVVFSSRNGDSTPPGGIRFDALTIIQPVARPWIVWRNHLFTDQSVSGLTGDVTVAHGGQRELIRLTADWLSATFPPRFKVHVARIAAEWQKMQIKDELEGVQPLQPLRIRGAESYIFYAADAQLCTLTGAQHQVGRYDRSRKPLLIKNRDGKVLQTMEMADFGEELTVRFAAPHSGFYRLAVDADRNSFLLTSANVPVALDATERAISLISSQGSLFVPVPAGTALFALEFSGSEGEGLQASVLDPSGKALWSRAQLTGIDRFTADHGEGVSGGLWQLKLERPATGGFEDYRVDVRGVPGFLFLHPLRYWNLAGCE